jgi:hypothetical protein
MVITMTSKYLDRSGTLLILAGILIAGSMLFHPDDTQPGFAFNAAWVPVHVLLGIGSLAGMAGLIGLYGVLRGKITAFGNTAFVTALLGSVLFTGLMFFVEATLLPVLASDPAYQPLLSDTGPLMGGPFGIALMTSFAIISLGYVLLAVYLVVSNTISVVNGLLFIGAPLAAFAPPLPFAVGIVGGVLLGVAFLWLGVSIRKGTAHKALESDIRTQEECLVHSGGHA